ncbi:hypothetical protein C2E23DRAFT_860061, partial [Lenzites betulinus]
RSLTNDDFVEFAERLIRASLELHPLEHADDELRELSGWLRVNLPKEVFDDNLQQLEYEFAPVAPPNSQAHTGVLVDPVVDPRHTLAASLHLMSLDERMNAILLDGTSPSLVAPTVVSRSTTQRLPDLGNPPTPSTLTTYAFAELAARTAARASNRRHGSANPVAATAAALGAGVHGVAAAASDEESEEELPDLVTVSDSESEGPDGVLAASVWRV